MQALMELYVMLGICSIYGAAAILIAMPVVWLLERRNNTKLHTNKDDN